MNEMNRCKCDSANTGTSGGTAFSINDFTLDACIHFKYSNWDEYAVFTCNRCRTHWFLQCDFVDRPPYLNRAFRLNEHELRNLLLLKEEDINNLVQTRGIRIIADILKGTVKIRGRIINDSSS